MATVIPLAIAVCAFVVPKPPAAAADFIVIILKLAAVSAAVVLAAAIFRRAPSGRAVAWGAAPVLASLTIGLAFDDHLRRIPPLDSEDYIYYTHQIWSPVSIFGGNQSDDERIRTLVELLDDHAMETVRKIDDAILSRGKDPEVRGPLVRARDEATEQLRWVQELKRSVDRAKRPGSKPD